MPLPEGGICWPPKNIETVYDKISIWSAWYSGDGDQLADVYGAATTRASGGTETSFDTVSRSGAGVTSRERYFWGETAPQGTKRTKLHVPMASDISMASADMLFSVPPEYICEDQRTQERLDYLQDVGDLDTTNLEAAEVASALCGVFLKIMWDQSIRDVPFLVAVHPDSAVPEFKYGVLTAVTFWYKVCEDDGKFYRFLERHEPGVVYHGLYCGTTDKLGKRVALTTFPQYAELPDELETIPGKLTAVYVPNMKPTRCWRSNIMYAPLGRSDYSGVEPLFDALDEAYTSWMRDLRLGKARMIIPNSYLQNQGRGKGATFDADQEYFQAFEMLGDSAEMKEVQFKIRVDEHERTCNSLVRQIIRGAGFSAASFVEDSSVALTATEVVAREKRTLTTRDKKIRYWKDQLSYILGVLLEVDAKIFGSGIVPENPKVEFSTVVREQPLVLANTLKILSDAGAVSTYQKIKMLHPTWTQEEVDEEVQRLVGSLTSGN